MSIDTTNVSTVWFYNYLLCYNIITLIFLLLTDLFALALLLPTPLSLSFLLSPPPFLALCTIKNCTHATPYYT